MGGEFGLDSLRSLFEVVGGEEAGGREKLWERGGFVGGDQLFQRGWTREGSSKLIQRVVSLFFLPSRFFQRGGKEVLHVEEELWYLCEYLPSSHSPNEVAFEQRDGRERTS